MPFSISQFIRVNRVYFIWAVFMLLLYLFRNMFGLVFITFIMCFIVFSITRGIRRKYRWSRRGVVVAIYVLFLLRRCHSFLAADSAAHTFRKPSILPNSCPTVSRR